MVSITSGENRSASFSHNLEVWIKFHLVFHEILSLFNSKVTWYSWGWHGKQVLPVTSEAGILSLTPRDACTLLHSSWWSFQTPGDISFVYPVLWLSSLHTAKVVQLPCAHHNQDESVQLFHSSEIIEATFASSEAGSSTILKLTDALI